MGITTARYLRAFDDGAVVQLQEVHMVHAEPFESLVHRADYVSRDVVKIFCPHLDFGGDVRVRSQVFEHPPEIRL